MIENNDNLVKKPAENNNSEVDNATINNVDTDKDNAKILGKATIEKEEDKTIVRHVVSMPNNGRTIEINRDTRFDPKNKFVKLLFDIGWELSVGVLFLYSKAFLGLKIEGKDTLKKLKKQKQGFIIVSNHVHVMDTPLVAVACKPYRVQFTSIESNFAIPVGGKLLSFFETIPIPESPTKLRYVFDYINGRLKEGGVIHFFPEGVLLPYDNHIRAFNKGAFMCAEKADVPVLPIVFTQRKAKGPFKYLKSHRCSFTARVLEPQSIDRSLKKRQSIEKLESTIKQEMIDCLNSYDENVYTIDYSDVLK